MDFDDPILSYLQNKTMYVTMKKLKKLNGINVISFIYDKKSGQVGGRVVWGGLSNNLVPPWALQKIVIAQFHKTNMNQIIDKF